MLERLSGGIPPGFHLLFFADELGHFAGVGELFRYILCQVLDVRIFDVLAAREVMARRVHRTQVASLLVSSRRGCSVASG